MTRSEFLSQLTEVRDRFDWQLSPESDCGGQTGLVRRHIRAVPKEAPQVVLDPLGAVCYINHNTAFKPSDWARAGELLGLVAPGEVAAAANDQTWAGTGPRREPVEYLQRLRQRLETAVGLTAHDTSRPVPKNSQIA